MISIGEDFDGWRTRNLAGYDPLHLFVNGMHMKVYANCRHHNTSFKILARRDIIVGMIKEGKCRCRFCGHTFHIRSND